MADPFHLGWVVYRSRDERDESVEKLTIFCLDIGKDTIILLFVLAFPLLLHCG